MPEGKAPRFICWKGCHLEFSREMAVLGTPLHLSHEIRYFHGAIPAWNRIAAAARQSGSTQRIIWFSLIVVVLSEFISQYRTITGHCFWRAIHNQTLDPEAITLVVGSLKLGAALAQSRVSTRRSKAARKPCLRRCGQSDVRATAEPALWTGRWILFAGRAIHRERWNLMHIYRNFEGIANLAKCIGWGW